MSQGLATGLAEVRGLSQGLATGCPPDWPSGLAEHGDKFDVKGVGIVPTNARAGLQVPATKARALRLAVLQTLPQPSPQKEHPPQLSAPSAHSVVNAHSVRLGNGPTPAPKITFAAERASTATIRADRTYRDERTILWIGDRPPAQSCSRLLR